MKKKIWITVSAILTNLLCFCQSQEEFVEVIASDTIKVVPDEIVFAIIIKNTEEGTYYPVKRMATTPNSTRIKTEERIRAIIIQQKIDTVADSETLPLIEAVSENIGKKFLLRFTQKQQMAAFLSAVQPIKDIMGAIVLRKSGQLDQYKEKLTKKITDKAFSEAAYICAQHKKTMGKLIQVKEEDVTIDKSTISGWTSYPPLSALANYYSTEYDTFIIMERKLRVRYAWQ